MDVLIEAGKAFTCEELINVLRKLVEAFAILQVNGIANRDIKGKNVILVEDHRNEGRYFYKISDFGIGCQIPKNSSIIPSSSIGGFTKKFAAPDVLDLRNESKDIDYNPFQSKISFDNNIWTNYSQNAIPWQ